MLQTTSYSPHAGWITRQPLSRTTRASFHRRIRQHRYLPDDDFLSIGTVATEIAAPENHPRWEGLPPDVDTSTVSGYLRSGPSQTTQTRIESDADRWALPPGAGSQKRALASWKRDQS